MHQLERLAPYGAGIGILRQFDRTGRADFGAGSAADADTARIPVRSRNRLRDASVDRGNGSYGQRSADLCAKAAHDTLLAVHFDETVDRATRIKLRGRGFLWSPKNRAWQRMLTPDAIWAAKFLGYIPKDWRPSKSKQEQCE